jgi:O-antigen ligase
MVSSNHYAASLFATALVASWLTHNHYLPWPAFHSDVVAGVGLLLATWLVVAGRQERSSSISTPTVVLLIAAFVPVLQYEFGVIFFAGDAWIAALYLCGAATALHLGFETRKTNSWTAEPLAWAIVIAGIASVGLALYQWLHLEGLGMWAEGLNPKAYRAYANFGQPNQLATFLIFALASAWWLYEKRRFGRSGFACLAAFFCVGIALAQSRAAYLAMIMLTILLLAFQRRAQLSLSKLGAVAIAGTFVAAIALLPWLVELRGSGIRTGTEHASAGTRPLHWAALVDAISRSPWFGYGWNQVPVAIAAVADDHPASHEFIHHSHNLVLDLLVWNGLPLGMTLIAAAGVWLTTSMKACNDAEGLFCLLILSVLLTHSMVEYPFAYAYFLLPAMFLAGVLHAKVAPRDALRVALPRWALALPLAGASALTVVVAVEYVRFEEDFRELRFEAARVGTSSMSAESPPARVLTQLLALNRFARTEARAGLSEDELTQMRKVAERFGSPQALIRHATAAALNGHAADAQRSLRRLCKVYPQRMCDEGREAWRLLASAQFPALAGVPFPDAQR